MLTSRSSLLLLVALIASSLSNANAEPVRAKRLLFPRQNSSFGGWGLRMVNCPAETQKCTNEESCAEVIETLPVCPDPSWTLWQNVDQHPFCCLPGQFGYQTAPGTFGPGSSCADSGMPVAASLLASSLVPAQGSGSATATGTARSGATTTRARSSATATSGSSEVDPGASSETAGEGSSPTIPAGSGNTAKSGLPTGAIAGIGAAAGIIGLALIAGGVWWGFKKGQQKGREGQVVVENFVPAPEYTVGGGGDGAAGAEGPAVAGVHEKPDGTMEAAEVYGTDGRRVEMQA